MKNIFLNILTLFIAALIVLFPESSIFYSKQALSLCYEVIIPSLFPFFVCSGLLIYSGFAETLSKAAKPIMKPLFNVNENGAAAFILGILSGYPLGAVTACQLYESAYLSKSETERLLAFCNNSGPLFILGAVGSAIYLSPKLGIILYISHILSAISVGIIFRFYEKNSYSAPNSRLNVNDDSISQIFSRVLANSINSILTVCGAIIFFFTFTNLVINLLPENPYLNAILSSILEMTGGIKKISILNIPLDLKLILSSVAIGFSGICVHIQVMSVTAKHLLSLKPYILGKILQALLSAGYTFGILYLFPNIMPTFKQSNAPFSLSCCFSSTYFVVLILILAFVGTLSALIKSRKIIGAFKI